MNVEQIKIQNVLKNALVEIRMRNPNISIRAFALRLDMGASSLSEILNGKRKVSKKLATKILSKLKTGESEQQKILDLFDARKEISAKNKTLTGKFSPPIERTTSLDMDSFESIAEWYHFAILSLAETRDFNPDPFIIGERLNICTDTAKDAIERLQRLGMFKTSKNGKIILRPAEYRTSDEVKNLALRKAHESNLNKAKQSLIKDPIELRDFNAMTMAIDIKKLPEAKELIREFKEKICEILESGHKSEVYKVCIQLFPLSIVRNKSSAIQAENTSPKIANKNKKESVQ